MGQVIPFRRSTAIEPRRRGPAPEDLTIAQMRLWSAWARVGKSNLVDCVNLWEAVVRTGVQFLDAVVPDAPATRVEARERRPAVEAALRARDSGELHGTMPSAGPWSGRPAIK